jgi:hypothetical protein
VPDRRGSQELLAACEWVGNDGHAREWQRSWRGLDCTEPNGRIGTCCCVAQNRLGRGAKCGQRVLYSGGVRPARVRCVNPYRGPRAAECLKEFYLSPLATGIGSCARVFALGVLEVIKVESLGVHSARRDENDAWFAQGPRSLGSNASVKATGPSTWRAIVNSCP